MDFSIDEYGKLLRGLDVGIDYCEWHLLADIYGLLHQPLKIRDKLYF